MTKFLTFLILVVAIGLGGYFGLVILQKDWISTRAETMSEKYVTKLYSEYQILGKNCQGEDTDSDGYVSCDLRISKGGDISSERVINLSCPTLVKSYLGSSCKERIALPTGN